MVRRNQHNVFEQIKSVRALLEPVLGKDCTVIGSLLRIAKFRLGRIDSLSPIEQRAFDLLLKNNYNPKTVYEWFLLENVPDNLRQQLIANRISIRSARYEYVKWKRMSHATAGDSLKEDIRKVVGCLRWESQEQ